MDFQEGVFQYKGVSLAYFQGGLGKSVLFLHGGGVRALTYRRFLRALLKKYRVIAPDLPCFGASSTPKETWGLDNYAECLDKFIGHLGLQEVIVIGHSMGGGVALNLATISDRVKGLVLVDSVGKSNGYSNNKFRYKFYIEKTILNLTHLGSLPMFLITIRDFSGNKLKRIFQWPHIIKTMEKCLFANFTEFPKVRIPTLILWGDKDEIFSVESASFFHKNISASTLKLVQGNHDWCLFKPDALANLIDQWIVSNKF